MPRNQKQGPVLLDWFNISYRNLFVAIIGLVAVAAVLVLYFLGVLSVGADPRSRAEAAIESAAEALTEAGSVGVGDEYERMHDEARLLLEQARAAFAETQSSDAREAATRSRNSSLRLFALASGGDQVKDVQFYKIDGHVQVKRARELIWRNANESTGLSVGDQIKTDSTASAQLIYFNGTITTIKPGTILEIKELYDDPATHVQKVRETLRTGEMVSSTQEGAAEGSFHEVSTETTSVTTRGRSEFQTRFDELNKDTSVGVYQGSALVRSGSREVQLGGRQRVAVNRSGAIGETVRLPPTPVLIEPIDQKIFSIGSGDPGQVQLRLLWEEIEMAGTYHLQISSSSLFGELLVDRASLKGNEVTLPPTEPGSYYWRVSYADEKGIESAFSETRKFKVIAGRIMNADDTTPPELALDDFLVFSSQVIVRGHIEPGAHLTADNKRVDVGEDGFFTTIIQLRKEGRNVIRFVAQDAAGNETTVERVAEVRGL